MGFSGYGNQSRFYIIQSAQFSFCQEHLTKKIALLRNFRARAVHKVMISFPRVAHPCGAFLFHRMQFPMK